MGKPPTQRNPVSSARLIQSKASIARGRANIRNLNRVNLLDYKIRQMRRAIVCLEIERMQEIRGNDALFPAYLETGLAPTMPEDNSSLGYDMDSRKGGSRCKNKTAGESDLYDLFY